MRKINIGVLTFPIKRTGIVPLSNLIDVVYSLSNKLCLITGNDGYNFFKEDERIHIYGIRHEGGANIFVRIIRYLHTQLRISYRLVKMSKEVDMWIFFIGGELVLPMLIAKLLRKKVVLILAGFPTKLSQVKKDPFSEVINFLSKINFILSNRIVVYSERIVKEQGLEKYRHKISIAKKHFLDFDKFKLKSKLGSENFVGYIGYLSEAKGVLNFVKAIPEILEKTDKFKFLIGGDGQLRDKIDRYLEEESLSNKVKLTGWIPHDNLPDYLNELKLVVLPSYTEGLPNIILEAMACGTPVLATPVGAIPDIIKDGETGFIMKNNSPECIAENVIRVLEYPNLDEIVKNAINVVEKEFTYEAAVERYRKILENV